MLRTKLLVPPLRSGQVTRHRLFEQLKAGLEKELILVSAPAGYGKTTLVSGWLHQVKIPSAWISLDEEDNDPIRFLHYLITAVQPIVPAINLTLLGVLQDGRPSAFKYLLNLLINEIAGISAPFVLVLDDVHAVQNPPVLEMLTYLLEHMPPQMHLILLSRADPPLPLARLRARNQVMELRANQLRFTPEETAGFLSEAIHMPLSGEDLQALEARTEGWIAGLQLASIALQASAAQALASKQDTSEARAFISAFTGSHYYIMDYLVEEVLRRQPERLSLFLMKTSILDRMCAPLCEAVVGPGDAQPGEGQAMLGALEQANLFTILLDSERRWYRYHHLFAEVLNRCLEQAYPQLLPELHRRASGWYEKNGYIFDAIRHSLAAGEREKAAQLLDQNGCQLLMRGEVTNLLHWIEAVEPYSLKLPWIAIQKGWALCLTGQLERAENPLQIAEALVSALPLADEVSTMRGAVAAARAYRANMRGENHLAAELARQALDFLPASSDFSCSLRSVATSLLGDASWLSGDLPEAERAYTDAVQISEAAGNIYMVILANTNLAGILMAQGKLHQAARRYSETLQKATTTGGQMPPLAEGLFAGLSRIAYEWNHLDEAEHHIRECIELSTRWGSLETQATGHLILARWAHTMGEIEKAREDMHMVELCIQEQVFTPLRNAALRCGLARLWIWLGDLDRAEDWVGSYGAPAWDGSEGAELASMQVPWHLTRLRLRLARGDYAFACRLSEWLLRYLADTRHTGWQIETLILQGLAFQGEKDIDRALAALKEAFSLAQPGGYRRIFLDEGEPMAKLLYQAKARRLASGYADELLSSMGYAHREGLPGGINLIEALTPRELEVLKLIEGGCSNQEIAANLVISLPTVKRHISNIYSKLGASSRTQALARGRELNLFQ